MVVFEIMRVEDFLWSKILTKIRSFIGNGLFQITHPGFNRARLLGLDSQGEIFQNFDPRLTLEQNRLMERLRQETVKINRENQELKSQLESLQQFIQNDPELNSAYEAALKGSHRHIPC